MQFMAKITKNFSVKEMQCPCCGECDMDFQFMEELQRIREICDFGFRVKSVALALKLILHTDVRYIITRYLAIAEDNMQVGKQ